jgi:hypothetical protein
MPSITPAKLAATIRYHLSELGAQNAHHEFEHLARHLARARVYSNILPATGPVSAGGDGGRDFETFRSGVASPATIGSTFVDLSSGARSVAFACTLQRAIDRKIRSDLKTIVANGKVDEIVYFCERDLAIGKRRKLIEEAASLGIELQIFDGTTIAEWLAEPDIFWIAQEYLHLPAEIVPTSALPDGYVAHRREWETRIPLPFSRADFIAIKSGLRRATFEIDARHDLTFWLDKMAGFLDERTPRDLTRNAMYEIAVATLRGRGDMTPAAGLVTDYFSDADTHADAGALLDAATLLTYCFAAARMGQFRVDEGPFFDLRQTLLSTIDTGLGQVGIGPGRRSGLLRVRGALEMTPAEANGLPDHVKAFATWQEMLDSAEQAPLYPIEAFADYLSKIIKFVGEDSALLRLADRSDEIFAARAGRAAAEKAVDRAFNLLERGDQFAAIRELHRAKAKWFSGERLSGTLRLLILLAEQYKMLGLAYAAKYQAMAAAFIARHEPRNGIGELQTAALLELLDAEDAAGNSFGFLQLLPILFAAHVQHDDQPLANGRHDRVNENMGQLAALLGFLDRANPATRAAIDKLTIEWPSIIRDPIWQTAADRGGFWNEGNWADVWTSFEEALIDRPFGDLGPTRRVQWRALGIRWTCSFPNRLDTTPAAEQLIAELQLIACAMVGRDLGIIPNDISIAIEIRSDAQKLSFREPNGQEAIFRVDIPTADRGPDSIVESLALFGAIIRGQSVLGDHALMETFDQSVFDPVFVGRPYAELYREFVPTELFAADVRQAVLPFAAERAFECAAGERVPWFDGPDPAYDEQIALKDVELRYSQILTSLKYSVKRLVGDPAVYARLSRMHDKGMKDWEILGILSNIAISTRLGELPDDLSSQELLRRALVLVAKPEAPEDALDPGLFTEDQLQAHSASYLGAFLNGRGLHPPQYMTSNGLEIFLVARYRLRTDDIDHENVFAW